MGKIHKALEKSKKEHQGKPKSLSSSSFNTGKSQKDITDKSVNEKKLSPDAFKAVSPELDLASIHGLLNDSVDSRAAKFSEKEDRTLKEIHADAISKTDPDLSFKGVEKITKSHGSTEEIPVAEIQSSRADRLRKTIDNKIAPDAKKYSSAGITRPETVRPDTDIKIKNSMDTSLVGRNESKNHHSINATDPSKSGDGKVFVLKEEALNEIYQDDIAETKGTFEIRKNEATGFDKGSKEYGPVCNSLVALSRPRSYEAEQFKILRTNLLFPESGKPARSILITSAAPGDGKSFVSSNLAVSLALDYNRKVLLIDADVRRSEILKIFGLNPVEKGICDFLTDRLPLDAVLVKTSLKNLVILPAGKVNRGAEDLQALEKLPKLFEELAIHYSDFCIVIDSPPPKLASETGVLARLADSIVIVIKAGVTKREFVEDTIDLIDKEKIAGIVFNWHENRMSNYKKYARNREYYSQ